MLKPNATWETAQLVARPPLLADAQVIFDHYASDTEVARYMTWRPHTDVAETLEFLRRCERVWVDGSAFPWSLWMKGSRDFVGFVEIRVHRSAVDLGYALSRRWWRQVYLAKIGSEARRCQWQSRQVGMSLGRVGYVHLSDVVASKNSIGPVAQPYVSVVKFSSAQARDLAQVPLVVWCRSLW
jgi:GNAT acetyltransferase-like protein